MIQTRQLTVEEFLQLYSDKEGKPELVRREVIEMSPPSSRHGKIPLMIGYFLTDYLRGNPLGEALVEGGYHIEKRPDTARGPDISVIRKERILPGGLADGFFDGPPDLAIQAVSPLDTAPRLQDKVDDCLKAGTRSVWLACPDRQAVMVYRPDGTARRYGAEATLEEPEILSGFNLLVRSIFE